METAREEGDGSLAKLEAVGGASRSQPLAPVPEGDEPASRPHGAERGDVVFSPEEQQAARQRQQEDQAAAVSGVSIGDAAVHWGAIAAEEEQLLGRAPLPVLVSKSSQLEAEALDLELTGMLQDQLGRVFSLLKPSAVTAFAPELDALFRSVIFSYTVWSNKPTPGAMFQNLIYSSSAGSGAWSMRPAPLTRRQRVLHAMLYVVVPYCWTRAGGALGAWGWGSTGEGGWRKRAWRAYVGAEATMRHATLVNFLLFIANGRYRTMSDRVVGARFMHIDAGMARSLSLDYVGYFLAWQGFTGLLSFLHPIVSAHAGSVKRRIIRAAGLTTTAVRGVVAAGACHECGASPANSPHVPGACGHVHCYYCLRANMMAQPGEYRCGGCGAVATQCAPATREQMEGGAGGGPREAVAAD